MLQCYKGTVLGRLAKRMNINENTYISVSQLGARLPVTDTAVKDEISNCHHWQME